MKVSELHGAELAQWVARAEGYKVEREDLGNRRFGDFIAWLGDVPASFGDSGFRPDKNWSQGGPIIDKMPRLRIQQNDDGYAVQVFNDPNCLIATYGYGKTILIAAMRCKVTSVFGPEVPDVKEQ